MEIVPLCIYKNVNTSYIGLPKKINKNDQITYKCSLIPNLQFYSRIWVINPDFRPIPPGTSLFCAKQSNYTTISINPVYDPFDIQDNCVRFITWMQPTPYTTPLYIYNNGSNYIISFDKQPPPNYININISPIYVLVDPNTNVERILPSYKPVTSDFNIIDGIPQYYFSGLDGNCVPDPQGYSLGKCVTLYNKKILSPELSNKRFTLLNYLQYRYGNKGTTNPFEKVSVYVIILLSIMLIGSIITIMIVRNK